MALLQYMQRKDIMHVRHHAQIAVYNCNHATSKWAYWIYCMLLYACCSASFPIQTIHCQLSALNKVLRVSSLMSSAVHSMATFLLRHEVPIQWCSLWDGPTDPFQYLRAVVAKAMALGWRNKQRGFCWLMDWISLTCFIHLHSSMLYDIKQQGIYCSVWCTVDFS